MVFTQSRRKIRVLAADDDHEDQMAIKEVFENIGRQIEFADSGPILEEKRDQITSKYKMPDIIMLDLFMPPLHGIDTLKRLKASVDWHHIPVIIYSNYPDPDIIEHAYESGATSFMPGNQILSIWLKPCRFFGLLAKRQFRWQAKID